MSRRERQRRRQRNKGAPAKVLFVLLGLVVTAGAIAAGVAVAWVINVANGAPSLDTKKPIELGATSRIYASDGKTRLGFINANILRTPVTSDAIPDVVRQATVAIEDRRFYDHTGFDPMGIARAVAGTEGLPGPVADALHTLLDGNVKKVLISVCLWLPYLLLSKRVNVTFRHRVEA